MSARRTANHVRWRSFSRLPRESSPMTEAEWLAGGNPQRMLAFLGGRASDRKLRLFACACCRRAGGLLPPEELRVVDMAEAGADGRADLADVRRRLAEHFPDLHLGRWGGGWAVRRRLRESGGAWPTADELARFERQSDWFPEVLLIPEAVWSARITARAMRLLKEAEIPREAIRERVTTGPLGLPGWRASWDEVEEYISAARRREADWPAAGLRDVFGNPFRPGPVVGPDVRTWNGGTVVKLARGIYEEGAFDRLPVLADALEDAGCGDPDLLTHCRSGGEHVRGCWAVDLLLGKE
jgi:hypothetical protein